MNPELIIKALLGNPAIVALCGDRCALAQLPQNTAMPAIVYQVVDAQPRPHVNYATEPQMAVARIQINPLAQDIAKVKAIHTALRSVLDFKHNTIVAGKRVVSCRFSMLGPMDKDNEAGVWTQQADYVLMWYE